MWIKKKLNLDKDLQIIIVGNKLDYTVPNIITDKITGFVY